MGSARVISKIKSSTVFAHQVCVTDLVKHIVKQTKKAIRIQNTVTLHVLSYHDALSLMTANLCVEWT